MKAILLDEAKKWLEENCGNQYTRMAVFGIMQSMPAVDYQETPNEPLTLEELGEMRYTDWVWLVFPGEKPSDSCWESGGKAYRLYSHERYGVSWIAYRRPPEGDEKI